MRPRSPIIAFLAASPFELLDLTGPAAVFAYPKLKDTPYYSFQILSTASGDTVKSMGGLSIGDTCKFSEYTGPIDTLVVVGGLGSIGYQPPELLEWLRKRASGIRRIASVCTGAFILAASGLLDGRRVATHWRYCDLFASRFRHLKVERDPIFIKDGKFYTTAGVSAGIDLALALIEEDRGRELSRATARELVVYHRRQGGQSQFSTMLDLDPESDRIRAALAFAREHLPERLSVARLAGIACLSPRQFGRAFLAETGETPAKAVERLRAEAARLRIETSAEAIEVIARQVGFSDPERMRRAFLRSFGQPPQGIRRAARAA